MGNELSSSATTNKVWPDGELLGNFFKLLNKFFLFNENVKNSFVIERNVQKNFWKGKKNCQKNGEWVVSPGFPQTKFELIENFPKIFFSLQNKFFLIHKDVKNNFVVKNFTEKFF